MNILKLIIYGFFIFLVHGWNSYAYEKSQSKVYYKTPHSPMDMSVKAVKPPPPDHLQISVFEEFPDLCAVSWSRMVFTPINQEGGQRMDFYEYRVMMPMIFNEEDLHPNGILENESGSVKVRYSFNRFPLRSYAGYYQFDQNSAVNALLARSGETPQSKKLPVIHHYFSRWSLFDESPAEDLKFIRSLGDIMDRQELYETETETVYPKQPKYKGKMTYKVLSAAEIRELKIRKSAIKP